MLIYSVICLFLLLGDISSVLRHPDFRELPPHLLMAILGTVLIFFEIGLVRVSFTVVNRRQETALWITCGLLGIAALAYSACNGFLASGDNYNQPWIVVNLIYWLLYIAIAIIALRNMKYSKTYEVLKTS